MKSLTALLDLARREELPDPPTARAMLRAAVHRLRYAEQVTERREALGDVAWHAAQLVLLNEETRPWARRYIRVQAQIANLVEQDAYDVLASSTPAKWWGES